MAHTCSGKSAKWRLLWMADFDFKCTVTSLDEMRRDKASHTRLSNTRNELSLSLLARPSGEVNL